MLDGKNLKITCVVLVVFLITFSTLYVLNDWYSENFDRSLWEEEFYSNEFDINEKKIFFLGSSVVVRINHTAVETFLLENNMNYSVYNLGIPQDLPELRINTIEKIILSRPDVVVYGLEFETMVKQSKPIPLDVIPTAKLKKSPEFPFAADFLIDNYFTKNFNFGVFPIKNPKFVSLQTLDMLLIEKNIKSPKSHLEEKSPFRGQSSDVPLLTHDEIKKKYKNFHPAPIILPNGPNAEALEKIVSELNEHNIKVVILIVPSHKVLLEQLSEEQIQSFIDIFKNLEDEYDIKVINFINKYSDLEIWNDRRHIGYHVNSTVYYNDIGESLIGVLEE